MFPSGPLKIQTLRVFLILSFAFSVVGLAVGLNALVKATQARSYINQLVVPYGIVDVGIHDVFTTGVVITVICALLAILSCTSCAFSWCPIKHKAVFFRIQAWALFLCAMWLLATLVTYDYFFATRSARITINLRGQRIPVTVIRRLGTVLGFMHAYRDIYFLRLLAVLPWFALIFAMIAGVMSCLAGSTADAHPPNAKEGERRAHAEPSTNA